MECCVPGMVLPEQKGRGGLSPLPNKHDDFANAAKIVIALFLPFSTTNGI